MDDTPRQKGKTVISVHVARYKIGMSESGFVNILRISLTVSLGPPTQEKAYKALLASEVARDTPRHDVIRAVYYINNGLRLERDQ